LAAFDAQSGELFNAYGLLWSYDINPQWILLGSFELRLVRGAVIDSPLVQQSSNRYANVGVAYQF
jgi:outer membrane scaffolding protein for murein synthesis (MipA/OmpV family)